MTIELANRLIELRKKHGYSQEELADKLNISRQAVSKWERSEASPDTDNLIELAKLYGVSMDELLGFEKEKEEHKVLKRLDDKTIVISDDEENEIIIKNNDIDEEDRTGKKHIVEKVFYSIISPLVIIAYIILGFTLGLWGQAWVLFFLIVLVPETVKLCLYGKWNRYPYPVLVAFTYLLLCVWILKGWWHPLWVIFLTIPIYYSIANIGKMKKK